MVGLTCIVPAFNEAGVAGIVSGLRKVLGSLVEYEIIVVDDGSEKPVEVEGASVIRHPQNMGYGASIKTGLLMAKGERILIIDADGTYPIESIPKLLESKADMVVGARTKPNASIPLLRRPAKLFLTKLANYLSETKIPDLNSGLRVFSKSRAMEFLHLYPRGFSFTTTVTLSFLCNDYTVEYIPIDYRKRDGKSKISPVKDGLNFTLLILRTIIYFNPLKVFLPLSILMLLAAAVVFAYTTLVVGRVMDITVISITVTAVEIALFGLLADLIVRRAR